MRDILFLAHRVPYPPDRGDKIRGFHVLRHLAERARVHLVAFADDPRDHAPPPGFAGVATQTIVPRATSRVLASARALASGMPVSLAAFRAAAFARAVGDVLATRPVETIYVFSGQMAQYVPAGARQRVVMDFVDMDSAKFAAYADAARGPVRWMLRREARLLGAFEAKVAARADASLFVSAAEASLFRAAHPDAARVRVVENGIDTVFFDPAARFASVASEGPLIVFTGQMDYPPNVEAVTWFARDVLPEVRVRHPAAAFAIVGRQPTAAVSALARVPGVVVTGEVADVRGWLAAAAVVVAPLRTARGIQNKVLEAMAMARPVVASASAADGIDHAGTIRVAADARASAEEVCALLDRPGDATRLGAAARARVRERYAWPARLAPLDALLGFDGAARRDAA